MTTEERISKIANKRVQLDNESAAEMKQRIDTICNLTDRIKAFQPRIAALMKVCAALCENKISIGKRIYRLGSYDEEFIAEGFFHKLGFYFVRFNRSSYLRGIGIRGGGACGNDLAVDERGFIFETHLTKHSDCGQKIRLITISKERLRVSLKALMISKKQYMNMWIIFNC